MDRNFPTNCFSEETLLSKNSGTITTPLEHESTHVRTPKTRSCFPTSLENLPTILPHHFGDALEHERVAGVVREDGCTNASPHSLPASLPLPPPDEGYGGMVCGAILWDIPGYSIPEKHTIPGRRVSHGIPADIPSGYVYHTSMYIPYHTVSTSGATRNFPTNYPLGETLLSKNSTTALEHGSTSALERVAGVVREDGWQIFADARPSPPDRSGPSLVTTPAPTRTRANPDSHASDESELARHRTRANSDSSDASDASADFLDTNKLLAAWEESDSDERPPPLNGSSENSKKSGDLSSLLELSPNKTSRDLFSDKQFVSSQSCFEFMAQTYKFSFELIADAVFQAKRLSLFQRMAVVGFLRCAGPDRARELWGVFTKAASGALDGGVFTTCFSPSAALWTEERFLVSAGTEGLLLDKRGELVMDEEEEGEVEGEVVREESAGQDSRAAQSREESHGRKMDADADLMRAKVTAEEVTARSMEPGVLEELRADEEKWKRGGGKGGGNKPLEALKRAMRVTSDSEDSSAASEEERGPRTPRKGWLKEEVVVPEMLLGEVAAKRLERVVQEEVAGPLPLKEEAVAPLPLREEVVAPLPLKEEEVSPEKLKELGKKIEDLFLADGTFHS